MSTKWTWSLGRAGLLTLGLSAACGATTSRHEPDASPPVAGGTDSDASPIGGSLAEAGAAPTAASGGKETSSGGATDSGGIPASDGGAGVAGAPSGLAGSGGGSAGGGGAGPVHDRCADPAQLAFVDGAATVSDDTSRATDEFPTLTCAGVPGEQTFRGGQLYYRFTARPGREYALSLEAAGFSTAVFYVFPAEAPCTVDAIRAACSSDGVTGTRPTNTPFTALTHFAPTEPGDYVIGVDTSQTKGAPFTLRVFEYCGTSSGTDCKVKGCDLDIGQTCLENTLSTCSDDGTATITTDCTLTGKSCHLGACVASVNDNIGYAGWSTSPAMTAGAAGVTLLDFYEVTTSRTLTKLEIFMVQPQVFALDWRILESTERDGPYRLIFSTTTMSAGSSETSAETTGPIQVPIVAGRFYAIGVALPVDARYYLQQQVSEKSLPLDVSFGQLTSSAVIASASSATPISYPAPDGFVIAQRLVTKL